MTGKKQRIIISTILKAFAEGVKGFVLPNVIPNEGKDAKNVLIVAKSTRHSKEIVSTLLAIPSR